MPSPHDVLGVAPDADEAAVRRAYRERVMEAHPDQGGTIREFRRVRAAYQALSGEGTDALETGGDPDEPETVTVEYLDYEVLDDHGWALDDDGLFARASGADLAAADHGRFEVGPDQSLLEAAEAAGEAWPFACRGGACSNCAVCVVEGEMPPPVSHVLTPELLDRGIRLSCAAAPVTSEARVVFNVKHLPGVEELLLPASRFERAHSTD